MRGKPQSGQCMVAGLRQVVDGVEERAVQVKDDKFLHGVGSVYLFLSVESVPAVLQDMFFCCRRYHLAVAKVIIICQNALFLQG